MDKDVSRRTRAAVDEHRVTWSSPGSDSTTSLAADSKIQSAMKHRSIHRHHLSHFGKSLA